MCALKLTEKRQTTLKYNKAMSTHYFLNQFELLMNYHFVQFDVKHMYDTKHLIV